MDDVNKRRTDEIFFLFLNLSAVPKKQPPGKFAYISYFQRIGKLHDDVILLQLPESFSLLFSCGN